MGFSVMLWGAEKLVPAEYWCPYGMLCILFNLDMHFCNKQKVISNKMPMLKTCIYHVQSNRLKPTPPKKM